MVTLMGMHCFHEALTLLLLKVLQQILFYAIFGAQCVPTYCTPVHQASLLAMACSVSMFPALRYLTLSLFCSALKGCRVDQSLGAGAMKWLGMPTSDDSLAHMVLCGKTLNTN